jgi:hypothetical protein
MHIQTGGIVYERELFLESPGMYESLYKCPYCGRPFTFSIDKHYGNWTHACPKKPIPPSADEVSGD